MMATLGADLSIGQQVTMEDHQLALGTLVPEILWHLRPGEQRADFRANILGEPTHEAVDSGGWPAKASLAETLSQTGIEVRQRGCARNQSRFPHQVQRSVGKPGSSRDAAQLLVQPCVYCLDQRPAALLAHGASFIGGLTADVGLDRIQGRDPLQRLGGERRFDGNMDVVEFPPRMPVKVWT